jgi:hypothetical protein
VGPGSRLSYQMLHVMRSNSTKNKVPGILRMIGENSSQTQSVQRLHKKKKGKGSWSRQCELDTRHLEKKLVRGNEEELR